MNYTNILQKCIKELKQEKPKLDYVLGMLEVLSEISEERLLIPTQTNEPKTPIIRTETVSDETTEPIPDFLRVGPMGKVN